MAALRNRITTVIIPADNLKDLQDIDQTVRSALSFVSVCQVDEVLAQALTSGLPLQNSGVCHQISEKTRSTGHAVNLRQ